MGRKTPHPLPHDLLHSSSRRIQLHLLLPASMRPTNSTSSLLLSPLSPPSLQPLSASLAAAQLFDKCSVHSSATSHGIFCCQRYCSSALVPPLLLGCCSSSRRDRPWPAARTQHKGDARPRPRGARHWRCRSETAQNPGRERKIDLARAAGFSSRTQQSALTALTVVADEI